MADLDHITAQQIASVLKFCSVPLLWADKDNHAGLLLATAQPEDDTGAFIPGVTLQLEIKRPIIVDRCLYEFGLFKLDHGVRRRVYQLHVSPADKRSHNGPTGPIYGPHEHVGTVVQPVIEQGVACGSPNVAFLYFCRRINLTFSGSFNSPL